MRGDGVYPNLYNNTKSSSGNIMFSYYQWCVSDVKPYDMAVNDKKISLFLTNVLIFY